MTDDSITTTERAEQAQAEAVERAWQVLLSAGIVTQEDIQALKERRRDRALLALAVDTLARAQAESDDVVSVSIVSSAWIYVAERGENPRIAPRVTDARRRKVSKASEASDKAGEAGRAPSSGAEIDGIPVDALKRASDELGVRWYGARNALRSKRVVARAREIAAGQTGQVQA